MSPPSDAACGTGTASGGAADGECVDAQRRLTDPHGNALAVLAAGADAIVELQVVADHRDAREHVRAVADERGALERSGDPTVLARARRARGEHELPRGDVHLAAAEVDRVDATLDGGDDLRGRVRPRTH